MAYPGSPQVLLKLDHPARVLLRKGVLLLRHVLHILSERALAAAPRAPIRYSLEAISPSSVPPKPLLPAQASPRGNAGKRSSGRELESREPRARITDNEAESRKNRAQIETHQDIS